MLSILMTEHASDGYRQAALLKLCQADYGTINFYFILRHLVVILFSFVQTVFIKGKENINGIIVKSSVTK